MPGASDLLACPRCFSSHKIAFAKFTIHSETLRLRVGESPSYARVSITATERLGFNIDKRNASTSIVQYVIGSCRLIKQKATPKRKPDD
jgi:hypothetical protein